MLRKTSILLCAMMVVAISLLVFIAAILHAEVQSGSIMIEDDGFDLDTGTRCIGYGGYGGADCSDADDFYFEYAGESFYLRQINGAQIAFLEVPFEDVDYEMASSQTLTTEDIDLVFGDEGDEGSDTIVVLTAPEGNLFKVGNALQSDTRGDFKFELLTPPPPIPFGEESYKEERVGDNILCINKATEIVYDCDNLAVPLTKFPITDMEMIIPGSGDPEFQTVRKVKDDVTVQIGNNTCYPWCYNGGYFVICDE